jgi:hypothetical protein
LRFHALLHPVLEIGAGDSVRQAQQRACRIEQLHRRLFHGHAASARGQGVGPQVYALQRRVRGVVLDDQGSAVPHVLEQAGLICAQVGPDVVGPDARDDRIEAGQVLPFEIAGAMSGLEMSTSASTMPGPGFTQVSTSIGSSSPSWTREPAASGIERSAVL